MLAIHIVYTYSANELQDLFILGSGVSVLKRCNPRRCWYL